MRKGHIWYTDYQLEELNTSTKNMTNTKIDQFVAASTVGSAAAQRWSWIRPQKARVIQADPSTGYAARQVYCFIRIEDGAILKAASWKAPAKGVRAWLDQILESDLAGVDQYTGWLYRSR